MVLLAQGEGVVAVMDLLDVSHSSLKRWRRNIMNYNDVIPPHNPLQGRPRTLTADQLDDLLVAVTEEPSIYLDELQTWMAFQHDVALTQSRYDSLIRECGFSFKQLRKSASERNPELRAHFHTWCNHNLTARMIITTDESSKDDRIVYRRYGRSVKGHRAELIAKSERGQRYSILPAMTIDGYIAVRVIEDSIDGLEFMEFIANDVVSSSAPMYMQVISPQLRYHS